MTSNYEKQLATHVQRQLDAADEMLPDEIKASITDTRLAALREARRLQLQGDGKAEGSFWQRLTPRYWPVAPAALAVALAVYVSYNMNDTIPALPADLLAAEMPPEDLSLLQDLEFADWLAQQEAEALL